MVKYLYDILESPFEYLNDSCPTLVYTLTRNNPTFFKLEVY